MDSTKLQQLLEWIQNSTDDCNHRIINSTSYISSKVQVLNTADSGRGLYATDEIKKKEMLIKIPHQFLLNFTSVVAHISQYNTDDKLNRQYKNVLMSSDKLSDRFTEIYKQLDYDALSPLTSFQLLAFYLTFECQRSSSFWKPFIQMLPQLTDFELVPLTWLVLDIKTEMFQHLPNSTRDHVSKMFGKFKEDFKVVKNLLAKTDSNSIDELLPNDLFLWAWMCINSRCLYMEIPDSKSKEDKFTMAPYVDFINHSINEQCTLKIDSLGFQVLTSSKYNKNDQIFFSYGAHSNEFLLCEYGFQVQENKWDYLNITPYIIEMLNEKQIEFLKDTNYYDDYTINYEGYSFRTEVVLAVSQEINPTHAASKRKLMGLINGFSDGSLYSYETNRIVSSILEKIIRESEKYLDYEFSNDDDIDLKVKKNLVGSLHRQRMFLSKQFLVQLK